MDALAMELDSRGNKAWHDNKMGSLTKADMETGVKESANFLLFLSEGVLMREYVQFAVQVALGAEKQVLLVTGGDRGWLAAGRNAAVRKGAGLRE